MSRRNKRNVVYVMGVGGCDTSSLISVLMNDDDDDNNDDKNDDTVTSSSFTNQDSRVPSPYSSSTISSSLSSSLSTSQPSVVVHEWTPSHNTISTDNNKRDDDDKDDEDDDDGGCDDVTLAVWEFGGTKGHHRVQSVITRPPCVVVVSLGLDESDGIASLTGVLNDLQAKCPGSYVIITLCNSNIDNKEDSRILEEIHQKLTDWDRQWRDNVHKNILDIECDLQIAMSKEVNAGLTDNQKQPNPSLKEVTHQHTDSLHTKLTHLLHIHDTVMAVSTTDRQRIAWKYRLIPYFFSTDFTHLISSLNTSVLQGVPQLRRTVIEKATSPHLFPHLTHGVKDEMAKVIEYVQDMKDTGNILVPLDDFNDVIQQRCEEKNKPDVTSDTLLHSLQASGHILLLAPARTRDWNSPKVAPPDTHPSTHPRPVNPCPTPFVCVNPTAFANMVLECLVEDDKKTYKLEANRFWPRDSGFKPPDPDLLARVLETLPQDGCIREAVLPILWQDQAQDQSQIIYTLRCLHTLGVLVFYEKSIQDCAGLAMPNYTLLSAQNTHASVMMDRIPKKRPQLNWTSKPFKDDIQVSWRMSEVTYLPSSDVRRCLGHVKSVFEPLCDYIHIWDEGVLIKFSDATVCMEVVKNGNSINVSCRVNADDAEVKDKTSQKLWVHLASVVKIEMDFLTWQLPGVVIKSKLSIFGSIFFINKPSQSEVEIPLVKCLTSRRFGGHVGVHEGMMEHRIDLGVLFPFEDENTWTPRDWIDLVMARTRQLNMSLSNQESRDRRSHYNKKRQLYHNKSSRKNKGVEIKWKTEEEVAKGDENSSNQKPSVTNPTATTVSDNDVTPQATSGDPVTPSGHLVSMTKEDWKKQASEVATRFVSCTMALGVADLVAIKSQHLKGKHTEAQVTAARLTADAALAVHTGDLEAAARAVIDAVHAVEGNHGIYTQGMSQHGGHHSRLCSIL